MVAIAVIHIVEISKRCPVFLGACDKSKGLALVVQHEHAAAGDLTLTSSTATSARSHLRAYHSCMGRDHHNLIAVRQVNLQRIDDYILTRGGRPLGTDLLDAHHPA